MSEIFAKTFIEKLNNSIDRTQNHAVELALIEVRNAFKETMQELGHNMNGELSYFEKKEFEEKVIRLFNSNFSLQSICDQMSMTEIELRSYPVINDLFNK